MLSASKNLPVGRVYTTKSTPGSVDYLSSSLLGTLYGTSDANYSPKSVFSRTESISIWVSSGFYATEFAVFHCPNDKDAAEIADLCLSRIDSMRSFINANSQKLSLDETKTTLDNAKVKIIGEYVIMAVCVEAEAAIEAAKEVIS